MLVRIDPTLKQALPDFRVGVMSFYADVFQNEDLIAYIRKLESEIQQKYTLADCLTIPNILAGRNGYKTLGKDPSRYRLAVESLYRRIVKGNPLYNINNVVDLGNVLSLLTQRSIAVLDYDKIVGDEILIRIGRDEPYEGIGRGSLNIENIPVYCDQMGPFGSPTSDTERTMITEQSKHILLFIISFNGEHNIQEDMNLAMDLYQKYANGREFSYRIV